MIYLYRKDSSQKNLEFAVILLILRPSVGDSREDF